MLSAIAAPLATPSLLTRHVYRTAFGSVATYTTVVAAQQSSLKDSEATAAVTPVSPLYSFHGLSKEHMFLSEMRHSRVAWSVISQHFQITPFEVLNLYIRVTSRALKYGWTPRMNLQDIEHHLTTPATTRIPDIDASLPASVGK